MKQHNTRGFTHIAILVKEVMAQNSMAWRKSLRRPNPRGLGSSEIHYYFLKGGTLKQITE